MLKKKLNIVLLLVIIIFFGWFSVQDVYGSEQSAAKKPAISHFKTTSKDIEYKKQILKDCGNDSYTLENLSPIVGPDELAKFIKANNNNPDIYTPSEENRKNGKFRANFHIHTTNSDGSLTVEELLNTALDYAKTLPENKYMYIAVTDHNTVLGSQDIIRVLQENPGKYGKLRIIPGIEIFTEYKGDNSGRKNVGIHVLTWCINPYNEFLAKEFHKNDLNDKWNYMSKDFDGVIKMMKEYGIVGVAHPARYSYEMGDIRYEYVKEMLDRYKQAGKSEKPLFIEGYYQSYPDFYDVQNDKEFQKYYNYINSYADEIGLMKTGSTDTHGTTIFHH